MEKKIISTYPNPAYNDTQDFRQKIGRGRKDPATGITFELWYHDSVYYAAARGENLIRIRVWGTLEEALKGMRNTARLGRIWEYSRIATARRRALRFGSEYINKPLKI